MEKSISSGKQIRVGAVLAYATIILEILLGVLYTPWMLKVIGGQNYYLYTLATSLLAFFFVDFALSNAVTRYVAKYHAEGKDEEANKLLGMVYKIYFVLDAIILVAAVIIFFLIDKIYVGLTAEQLASFKVIYCILCCFTLFSFPTMPFNGILSAHERFISLKLCGLLLKLFSVCSIIVVLLICSNSGFSQRTCLYLLVILTSFWQLFFAMVKLILIKKNKLAKANFKESDKALLKNVMGFSLWVTIMQFADRLFVLVTPSLFGIFSNADNGAIYSLAVSLEAYAYTFACSINGMFIARVTQYISEGNSEAVERLMIKVGKIQSTIQGLVICGFALLGKQFLGLWAYNGLTSLTSIPYETSLNSLYICSILLFINLLFSKTQHIAESVAFVKTNMKFQAFSYLITGVIYIGIGILFLHLWGVIGVCIALAGMTLIRTICIDIYYQKKLGLNIVKFAKNVYLRIVLPVAITIFACYWLKYFGITQIILGWGASGTIAVVCEIAIKAIIISILYLALCWLLYLNKDERKNLLSKIRRKKVKTEDNSSL